MFILSVLLGLIFSILSMIHVYWAFGGRWGIESALPENPDVEINFSPGPLTTLIVAFGLMAMSLFYLDLADIISLNIPNSILPYIGWSIPILFLLRGVGDFKYVGLFKRIRGTKFSRMDSILFTPLCLFIGISGILTQLL